MLQIASNFILTFRDYFPDFNKNPKVHTPFGFFTIAILHQLH